MLTVLRQTVQEVGTRIILGLPNTSSYSNSNPGIIQRFHLSSYPIDYNLDSMMCSISYATSLMQFYHSFVQISPRQLSFGACYLSVWRQYCQARLELILIGADSELNHILHEKCDHKHFIQYKLWSYTPLKPYLTFQQKINALLLYKVLSNCHHLGVLM